MHKSLTWSARSVENGISIKVSSDRPGISYEGLSFMVPASVEVFIECAGARLESERHELADDREAVISIPWRRLHYAIA